MKTPSPQQSNSQVSESNSQKQASTASILDAYRQGTAQLKSTNDGEPIQPKENKTGLPDNLKSGVENLSGHSLDDVKVHYNSSQPAALQAHAYAQGTDIHVAPGQEKHLPHEAWHVVQQKQGRVQPTKQLKGKTNINDDAGLEKEADVMGAKAATKIDFNTLPSLQENSKVNTSNIVQRVPTIGNAGTFDQGTPNYTAGAFASTAANVLTTRANHNNASAPANPVNCVNIFAGRWLGDNYQAGVNLALTANGTAPILTAIQNTPDINGIANPHRNNIAIAARNTAVQAGATSIQIATAARQVLLNAAPAIVLQAQQLGNNPQQILVLQNNIITLAGNFYNDVLNSVPAYATPTEMWIQGGISAGNAGNQLTRVHIIHHALGAGTNNNGNNIFWGNPGFNNPQILVEETRMLNFLNGGPQTFNGGGLTIANNYFGGNNNVVAHNGLWYSPAGNAFPVKVGNNIAGALYATINAAFNNANLQYQQVDTNSLPRTGDYSMTVDYNQHNTNNMQVNLANALITEYNNRVNPLWVGENNGLVAAMSALMLNEARASISSQVTVTQEHQSMAWNPAPNAAAAINSAIPISQATTWQVVANHNNPVRDNGTPCFRLGTVYRNANNNPINGAHIIYPW